MRYEVELVHLPGGYAAQSANKGETVSVITSDFAIPEGGRLFYKYLEGFEKAFLQPFHEAGHRISRIEYCLVIISKDKKVKVYINEPPILVDMIPKKDVIAGEAIETGDVAGITGLSFQNLNLPSDCGIAFYFTVGWRQGFFFDYSPLNSNISLKFIERRLGSCYESLVFSHVYSLDQELLDKLYASGWFPFVAIFQDTSIESILLRLKDGKSIEFIENEIIGQFTEEKLQRLIERFRRQEFLKPHIQVIETGFERYLSGDYISCINNIWLRIEGILRYAFSVNGKLTKQDKLLETMSEVVTNELLAPAVFLPKQFKDYMWRYYFKNFDIEKGKLEVSRQSISHGVSDANSYDKKRALIGILIVDQLSYYLQLRSNNSDNQ